MKRLLPFFVTLFLFGLSGKTQAEEPELLTLANGVQFELVQSGDWLLGVGGFRCPEGLPLTVPETVHFPLIADEWAPQPAVGLGLRLVRVEAREGGADLHLEIRASQHPSAWLAHFHLGRDAYRYARLQPVAELTRRNNRQSLISAHEENLFAFGEMIWQIRPHDEIIAGWPWTGWSYQLILTLDAPHQTTAIRWLGGLEVDGTLENLTLANHRYRGFGNLAQTISVDENGHSQTAYNTQDLPIPDGFRGRSHALPRDLALAGRNESWIHTPARGAGSSFFDFQYNTRSAGISFPERQGNHRSLTEIYPGDSGVGQTSEEHFAQTRAFTSQKLLFLSHHSPDVDEATFWKNRYLEWDRELRARVGHELGFFTDLTVPTVGYLFDFWGPTDSFAPVVARMSTFAGRLAELGVQRVMVHNPGWLNGRAARWNWDGMARDQWVGGGVNSIYDWKPLPRVERAWRETSAAYDRLGIEYHVWITGMSHREAGFVQEVGLEPMHWALNSPDGPPNATYGEHLFKYNILDERFRSLFSERLRTTRMNFGLQGFWGDSFQNLFMSQLDWASGNGQPMQRAWWEWLAEKSREGFGWISESHSFPGLSCTIETDNFLETPWMLGFTTRWLRGHDQDARSATEWGRLAFRMAAFQAWLAPEIWPYEVSGEIDPTQIIAGFGRLAHEYRAAFPLMEYPAILRGEQGVLWQSPHHPGKAALFAFARIDLPDEVEAREILDFSGQTHRRLAPQRVYLISGNDLLTAFHLPTPPRTDQRTPLPVRAATTNLAEPESFWTWRQPPGEMRAPVWTAGDTNWRDEGGATQNWPEEDFGPVAHFSPGTITYLKIDGVVRSGGLHAPTSGLSLILNTAGENGQGDLLHLNGPLTGPVDIYFQNTLRGGEGIHTLRRTETGLRFSGGGVSALTANLLPWPENYHRHSQIVSLTDSGTTVHFQGQWPATGELSRPGLVLDDETRFVIEPQAQFPFIKNYGGFTLQLWVTGAGEEGGTLELHQDFVADRSRMGLSPVQPDPDLLRLGSLGSLRFDRATLISHHSQSLPMTGRARHDTEGTIQNNGHLVFEGRDGGRWEVQTRPQTYRGAVWIHADTTLVTHRDLTHLGVTEAPDKEFHYTAANAFQTIRNRHTRPGPLTIRKEGPATLVLAGEQAYAEDSHLVIAEGSVRFASDPAAGGRFPDGTPHPAPHLHLQVLAGGKAEFSAATLHFAELSTGKDSLLQWNEPVTVRVSGPATIHRIHLPTGPTEPLLLLEADSISGQPMLFETGGTVDIRAHGERTRLWYLP